MRQRIYIDTSVIGGYHDDEFKNDTRKLFERIADKEYDVYFSEVNETELFLAPENVREVKSRIPETCYHYIELNDEVRNLADTYLVENILGESSYNDALHIALATIHRLDCLISWNFKHIVNFDKIRLFNSVNLRLGYQMIDIRSPLEFLKDEN